MLIRKRFKYFEEKSFSMFDVLKRFLTGKGEYDKHFEQLLAIDFWRDFHAVMHLAEIPSWQRSEEQEDLFKGFQDQYPPDGKCQSWYFPRVSRRLQNEYRAAHNAICSFLYPAPTDSCPLQERVLRR